MQDTLAELISDVARSGTGITWSICIRDASAKIIASHGEERTLWTASVGKVLLLMETARRIEADPLLESVLLSRYDSEAVDEAGLWQHLRVENLPLGDVATLVGSVSDNLAANVLLHHIGLDAVAANAADLGLSQARLLDFVRRERTASDPPNMSCGSAAELSLLMSTLATGSMARPGIAPRVTAWLRLNMDLSMVGGALDLDPLSHRHATTGIALFNKTGSDAGVRADTGSVQSSDATVSYAVIANWPPSEGDATHDVLAGMRRIGFGLRDHLTALGKRRRTHHGVV